MSNDCSLHRLPHAGVDPIDTPADALSMLTFIAHQPLRHETIAVLLDHGRCGRGIFVVAGTAHPDAMFDVLDAIVALDVGELGAVILGSVRPSSRVSDELDVDRWLEASSMLDDCGLDLLEWFVIGDDVICPRDLLGEPPRW
jgi:hypothetical protein